MLFFLYFFCLVSNSQDLKSTSSYLTHSLYDISYSEKILNLFSQKCEIAKSSETINFLFSLKNMGYTRSDIYAFISCVCKNDVKLNDAFVLLKPKRNSYVSFKEFLKQNKCDYFSLKKEALKYLEREKNLHIESDLELVRKIIDKYFK